MEIREATVLDSDNIHDVHLQAFDASEANIVAGLAVDLLNEQSPDKTISLVAIDNEEIVGHVAFSPVYLQEDNRHFAYLLAPLGVTPEYQGKKVGSALVEFGMDMIAKMGAYIVFVYGDPRYYSRFGFETSLAENLRPRYELEYPNGWHAMKLGEANFPESGVIKCVPALEDPALW